MQFNFDGFFGLENEVIWVAVWKISEFWVRKWVAVWKIGEIFELENEGFWSLFDCGKFFGLKNEALCFDCGEFRGLKNEGLCVAVWKVSEFFWLKNEGLWVVAWESGVP